MPPTFRLRRRSRDFNDEVENVDFSQQLLLQNIGEVLAVGFSPPLGLYEFSGDGTQANAFTNIITSPRGIEYVPALGALAVLAIAGVGVVRRRRA